MPSMTTKRSQILLILRWNQIKSKKYNSTGQTLDLLFKGY